MPWGHTSCPAITGWQNRAQGKVAAAGADTVVKKDQCVVLNKLDNDRLLFFQELRACLLELFYPCFTRSISFDTPLEPLPAV